MDAVDISDAALGVARENALAQHVRVDFAQSDLLSMKTPAAPEYDIIVSNPPYIPQSDAKGMDRNVLDYEPGLALFVPDADPMKFYRPIATYASGALLPGGMLYVELDPAGAESNRLYARCRTYRCDILPRFCRTHTLCLGP